MLSLDKNAEMLSSFGLTNNQAKVYLATARLGIASVSQISKASKVRREDVYRMLPKLGKMGLIEKILGKPTKIRAIPVGGCACPSDQTRKRHSQQKSECVND